MTCRSRPPAAGRWSIVRHRSVDGVAPANMPHAATMRKHQGGDVRALDSETLSTTATCSQYHVYGRSPGLKIRSSQEGGGSSLTFGTDAHIAISVVVTASTWIGHSLMVKGRNWQRPAAEKPI